MKNFVTYLIILLQISLLLSANLASDTNGKMLFLEESSAPQENIVLAFGDITPPVTLSSFTSLLSIVDQICFVWKQIVQVFKVQRKTTIKQALMEKGFDYFSGSGSMQVMKGIQADKIEDIFAMIQRRIKVPSERQEEVKTVLDESLFMEKNVWSSFNTVFSIDETGDSKFANIMVSNNEQNNTYNVIYNDFQAKFKLAPDVLIINKQITFGSGIFQNSEDKIMRVPKSLTQEDITIVLSFFQLITYKHLADHFKINLELPK